MSDCIFCALQQNEASVIAANDFAYAVLDITSRVYLEGGKTIAPEDELQAMRDQLRERFSASDIA